MMKRYAEKLTAIQKSVQERQKEKPKREGNPDSGYSSIPPASCLPPNHISSLDEIDPADVIAASNPVQSSPATPTTTSASELRTREATRNSIYSFPDANISVVRPATISGSVSDFSYALPSPWFTGDSGVEANERMAAKDERARAERRERERQRLIKNYEKSVEKLNKKACKAALKQQKKEEKRNKQKKG
ncbi:uncharacterized protein BCR38DRAFT_446602 [Pseudomassariella vexata]|uniref:Uncharacterized protein n=1 Tax=Pseudomassariella vexata TaxID=1141098 RepID=A0A1Y2DHT7_9PEZI|nr:uncharacterized protein BCR38DRAFT_446602 [Pseudomassariella vexata]ORY58799.1 hypothetical protein BCR38DRAFT_446602 [Pseudomassariella vexata]